MHIEVREILRKAYLNYGEQTFCNSEKLKGILYDLLHDYSVERKRLFLAINENIVYRIINEKDEDRHVLYAKMLTDTYALPDDVASEIIGSFYYAITGIHKSTQNKNKKETASNFEEDNKRTNENEIENNTKEIKNQRDYRYKQESYPKATRMIAWALLIILALFILCVPFLNSSNDTGSDYESTEYVDNDANIIPTIEAKWDENNRVVINDWEVSPQVLDRTVYNCIGFTINMNISDVMDGYPYGTWIVCLRNEAGVWNEVHRFEYEEYADEMTISVLYDLGYKFEPFDAITLVRESHETSNHSYGFSAYDFIIEN